MKDEWWMDDGSHSTWEFVVRKMSKSCLQQQNGSVNLQSQQFIADPPLPCFIRSVSHSFTHLFIHCLSLEETAVALVMLFPWIIETSCHELFSSRKWGRGGCFIMSVWGRGLYHSCPTVYPLWPFKGLLYLLLHIWWSHFNKLMRETSRQQVLDFRLVWISKADLIWVQARLTDYKVAKTWPDLRLLDNTLSDEWAIHQSAANLQCISAAGRSCGGFPFFINCGLSSVVSLK